MATPAPAESAKWLATLSQELDGRQESMGRLDRYYAGEHPLIFNSPRFVSLFGKLFRQFSDNWCGVVVDAVEERLDVEGIRFPVDPADKKADPLKADEDAWRIWQSNQLDADSGILHTETLVKSLGYVLVSPLRDDWIDERTPRITIEDALQTAVALAPGSRRQRLAGLKRWLDPDSGLYFATLYLPDRIEKYQTDKKPDAVNGQARIGEGTRWVVREVANEPWPLPNPLGIVPVVPFENRPRLSRPPESEIAAVMPLQNAANWLFLNMLVTSHFAAFPQRWATGVDIPVDQETGENLTPSQFEEGIGKIMRTIAPDAKFGEFTAADLANFTGAIDTTVKHIASITRTPQHYFLNDGGQPSGETLRAAEAGLVAKTRRRARHFGESWEEVHRLAFLALEDPRGKVRNSEMIWSDPEYRTEAEHVDALVKMQSLGVPNEVLWEKWGATPQEIQRWKRLSLTTAFITGALNPATGNGRNGAPLPPPQAPAKPPAQMPMQPPEPQAA